MRVVSSALSCWALLLVVVPVLPLDAQLPLLAAGAVGLGPATGGVYANRQRVEVGARLGIRVFELRGIEVLVGGAAEHFESLVPLPRGYNDLIVCTGPTGSVPCPGRPDFPTATYVSGFVRLQRRAGDRWVFGANAGLGSVGVVGSSAKLAASGTIDVAFRLAGPFHLVLGGEAITWVQAGNTVYLYPIELGLRIN